MKTILLLTALFSFSAQASYYATYCSDAHGSVKWADGHANYGLIIKEGNREIEVPTFEVDIDLKDEKVLKNEKNNDCRVSRIYSETKIYAAKATIKPSKEYPNALNEISGEKKIEAYVICHYHMNSMMPCPQQ